MLSTLLMTAIVPREADWLVDLGRIVGGENVLVSNIGHYLADQAETSGVRGSADAVVLPRTTEEVQATVAYLSERRVPIVPRGGGTGYAGGAIPSGGVVIALERMNRVRSFEPLLWRIEVEAGVTTERIRGLARDSGLYFPPDPGAAESSQIGGNIATNAGGPHAFKYGTTGQWVSGLEVVMATGAVISVGGPLRKDVAGYDLKSLLVGSEGTLGIVTAAWLKLIPAPEVALPVVAFFESVSAGCDAIEAVIGNGLSVAALEFLDGEAFRLSRARFSEAVPDGVGFVVIAEADGSASHARQLQGDVLEVLAAGALASRAPEAPAEVGALWRWRDGVSGAVAAAHGGKLSEDIVVPVERLREAIDGTIEIGRRHDLPACSWGHAGDGNIHSTFMFAASDPAVASRASEAAEELFALAIALGGSVSGEHGLGLLKRGQLSRQWPPAAVELHRAIKRVFDPDNIMNPGKKEP